MRRSGWMVLLLAAFLPLSGCKETFDFLPYAREIEDMALMRTLGVDLTAEGVRVTASTGIQDQGAKPPTILEEEARSISAACLSMQAQGAAYVFYGHVGQLLLGEDLARQGVRPALDYVMRDIEMRLETKLYVLQGGEAGAAIQAAAQEDSAAEQLEALEADAGLLSDFMNRTVEEVLEDLEENGDSFVPALTLGENGRLEPAGYALIQDGALVGWAQGEAAMGINLLQGWVDADVLEVDVPTGRRAALRLVGAKTRVEPVFEGDSLTGLRLRCRVNANLAEYDGAADEAVLTALERALEERCRARLTAVAELCRTLEGDFVQFAPRAGRSAPWRWSAIQEQWNPAGWNLDVVVEAELWRGYNMREH